MSEQEVQAEANVEGEVQAGENEVNAEANADANTTTESERVCLPEDTAC